MRAYNACYRVHFPELPELTVERFKSVVRERDLWTSSCMVVFSGADPIGVLLAGKRDHENLIYRLGIHPEHRRGGHGRHLLTSLASKLAILGPRRIVAEVPEELAHARSLLSACGYVHEAGYTDFVLRPTGPPPPPHALVTPVSVDDLLAHDLLGADFDGCWERFPGSLVRRKREFGGLAMASDERIEGYLLYHEPDPEGMREIVALHCAHPERAAAVLGTLVRLYAGRARGAVRIAKVAPQEAFYGLLEGLGFRPGQRTARYAAEAREA